MKKFLTAAVAALSAVASYAAYIDLDATEHRTYKVGETVKFTSTAYESKGKKLASGSYTLVLRDSAGKKIAKDVTVDIAKNNPYTFTAKLDRPGFILASATPLKTADGKSIKWDSKVFESRGGAAVEPLKIKAGAERPADFNDFWKKGIEEFKKAEVVVTPDAELKYRGCKVFRVLVKFPDGTGAIDGFLAVPVKPGKYPALVGVPAAGPGSVAPGTAYSTSKPAIKLWMNVHNFRTAKTASEQKARYAAYNKSFPDKVYTRHNAEDRNKYIFRNVWLSVNRAIDLIFDLKEFDGKNLASVGSSQGGGTALALAGLNPRITAVVANVPALCDHHGWKVGRGCGWPGLHRAKKGKADDASHYFDAANFALNIKVPVLISAGFIDNTCPPSTVYAAFNNVQCKDKTIFPMYRFGHTSTAEFSKAATEFLDKHLLQK